MRSMSKHEDYFAEGKYRCNHPESDFIVKKSSGPIEIKREKGFIEYTHRNETANYQYDVWNKPSTSARINTETSYSGINTTNSYYSRQKSSASDDSEYRRILMEAQNRQGTNKKGSLTGLWIFLGLFYGLPIIFSILASIFD